jgi:hypothetical protein
MAHKQGVISKVYSNYNDKTGRPLASDKINHKFYIGDEIFIIKGKYLPEFIKEGKGVSFAYTIWSPAGADKAFNFVASDNGTVKIQELKAPSAEPDTSFNVDDFDKEAVNVASDLGATLTIEPKTTVKFFNKDQYMFIMAMTKSALESKGIQCNKESIDSFIKDMKLVYSYNF